MKKTSVFLSMSVLFLMLSSTGFAGTIFGPNQYDRTSGASGVFSETFSATPGEASLIITNGNESGNHRVTSALVFINDKPVVKADDLKQKDYKLEIPLQLLATNSISIELKSKPGTYLSVEITQQKTSVSFSCSPESIFIGQSATLNWSSVLADTVSIDNGIGDVPPSGSLTVSPTETTTYTITATGPGGTASGQATVTVSIVPAPVVTLNASKTDIIAGESVTLSWTSINADSCNITPGVGAVDLNGSLTVTPAETTTYTLTATGQGGTSSASAAITVISPITLQITSPANGETILSQHVMVKGTIANATGDETGVVVNGMAALEHDGQFLINRLPMAEGLNTITSVATDSAGAQVSQEITVTAEPPAGYIRMDATQEAGLAPFETELYVSGSFSLTTPAVISSSDPGSVLFLESGLDRFKVRLTTAGIYYFTATATDGSGSSFTDTIAVVALDPGRMDTMLRAKWNGMVGGLSSGDTVAASGYFSSDIREKYAANFDLLKDHLPEIASGLHDMQLIKITENEAEYSVLGDQDGQTFSFYVLFVKDADGIWRIRFF